MGIASSTPPEKLLYFYQSFKRQILQEGENYLRRKAMANGAQFAQIEEEHKFRLENLTAIMERYRAQYREAVHQDPPEE